MSTESFSEKHRAKVRKDVDGTMIVPGKFLHDHPRGGRPGLSIKSSGFAFLIAARFAVVDDGVGTSVRCCSSATNISTLPR
jgi:hypothetical protein